MQQSWNISCFCKSGEKLAGFINALQANAEIIALVDVMQSFAQAAYDNDYVKPAIREDGVIEIKEGVIQLWKRQCGRIFVPNDTYLDTKEKYPHDHHRPQYGGEKHVHAPNRPDCNYGADRLLCSAASASISIVDRVFTRVGASDDLASGQEYLYGGDERTGQHFE